VINKEKEGVTAMSKNKTQFQKGLSLEEFLSNYGTEEQCLAGLIKLRWADGFVCPRCQCKSYCRLKSRRFLFQCNACRGQQSVTAGTIYHSTKMPLTKWFLATYLMTQSKSGISQLELARQLGVSANTGAMVYHKLAQVMLERDAQKPLSGKVEIDDAYWGGKKKGKRGRGSENKTPFVAAVEKDADNHPVRIKLSVVSGFKKKELGQWSKKNLVPGTVATSDGLHCFKGIKEAGFGHQALIVGNGRDPKKSAPFNWVNTVLGNLKSALSGIYHKLSSAHLPRHLATFQYRFNRRFVLGDMINRLVFVALRTLPMPGRLLKLAEIHW
jgi:transposase-like protein